MRIGTRDLEVVHSPAPPGRPTLVFLHEGLGSVSMWRHFPTAVGIACAMGTLVYSRYGHGQSEVLTGNRTVRYMHDEALVVLPEVLRAAGIEKPILVGHSDGASIALIYAGEHPDAVRALVVLAPHLFVEDLSLASIASVRERYSDVREKLARHHRDADATFRGWNDIWLDSGFRQWNIEAYVANIIRPTLAIQGMDDEYGTIAQVERLAERSHGPVDRLILAGCGHSPQRDRRNDVVNAIAGWVVER
jgi:pimeloyl-ACP methyl ester carboxylesterase